MTNKELLKVIEEVKASRATVLDLSCKGITALPSEIGQLNQLTRLDLKNNQLTSLPTEICQLTNLTDLNLCGNQFSSLPPEICQLTNLTWLDLSGNQFSSLPPEIWRLTNLTWLYLSGNRFSSLPPEICQLTNLTLLDLCNNQLTTLPPEICQLTNLDTLYLYKNPSLSSPPIEIVSKGMKEIKKYFIWIASREYDLKSMVKSLVIQANYDVIKEMLGTKGTPYSPEAETMIGDFYADYGEKLVLEAARIASREGLQQISTGHVDDAMKRLRTIERRSWQKKLREPVGGASLGLGLSTLAPCFVNSSSISISTLIICVIAFVVAAVLLMYDVSDQS